MGSEDDEKEQEKVPIFPKPKMMNDVFSKQRHRGNGRVKIREKVDKKVPAEQNPGGGPATLQGSFLKTENHLRRKNH